MMAWALKEKKPLKPYDSARFYTINGRRLPSVTTILDVISKPALGPWMVKQQTEAIQEAIFNIFTSPGFKFTTVDNLWDEIIQKTKDIKAGDRAKTKAANIGTSAHAGIEWHTRKMMGEDPGGYPGIPEEAQWAVEAWKDWARAVEFKPIETERPVYSLTHGYAGTLDFHGYVKGVLTVGDYKTGKAIYSEAFLQNIAYRHAANEMGIKSEQGIILRLPKTTADPEFESQWVPKMDINDFLACKRLWEWKRKMEGKEIGT